MSFSLNRELDELVNKLSTVKKIGFFFGAGSSMALNMPGIFKLTEDILIGINSRNNIKDLLIQVDKEKCGKSTIEDILNKIRVIRELTRDMEDYSYLGINGKMAKELDEEICNFIYDILSSKEEEIVLDKDIFNIPKKFFVWYNNINCENTKEIFTANYDLLFERSMESLSIPYFDGFVGAHRPFFFQESVEDIHKNITMPCEWIRLWKIHGSLGWFWEEIDNKYRVVRLGANSKKDNKNELVIYPSKDKYQSSRKQPFISYFDRLKSYLSDGEGVFIVSGYSFADEHINDVFYESLRKNPRMHVIVMFFEDQLLDNIQDKIVLYPNITVYCPSKVCLGGKIEDWGIENDKLKENGYDQYLAGNKLKIGDFKVLVEFLVNNSGRKRELLEEVGVSVE
ncbi:SIR2 family protein [Clostridium estertheticum]|uniref:SIR2 family protein n=1 Tax=Clostridium estertheticum TaxID=238834 RepID=A0AA47EG64_9CLOT|nr:SIR2 family protein [Clostridium estertheticum]MBU3156340.1 SIR2 family protein [Clostridium estertheticum]WAG59607.1 SIR2 family protein [Clostridium estertheticum]